MNLTFFFSRGTFGLTWSLFGAVLLALNGCQKESGPTAVVGQVVEFSTGQPVPNAQVRLTKYGGGSSGSIGGAGSGGFSAQGAPYLADAQGHFEFTFNAESHGSYALRASKGPYYQEASDREVILSNGRPNRDLHVPVYASAWARYVLVNELPKKSLPYSVYVGGYGQGFRLYHPRDTTIVYPVASGFAYKVIWIVTDAQGQDTNYEKDVLVPPLDTLTVRLPF